MSSEASHSEKVSILVVDDDTLMAASLKQGLETTGRYHVYTLSEASSVMETARRIQPALILLDLLLPECSSLQVHNQLAADPEVAGIPVIFLSGLVEEPRGIYPLPTRNVQGVASMSKPVNLHALIGAIEAELRISSREPAGSTA